MTNDSISFHFSADEIKYLITDSPMHLLRPIFSVLHSLIQCISELLLAASYKNMEFMGLSFRYCAYLLGTSIEGSVSYMAASSWRGYFY
jgi:hypothetical protein